MCYKKFVIFSPNKTEKLEKQIERKSRTKFVWNLNKLWITYG
jgi:hypothetical protein